MFSPNFFPFPHSGGRRIVRKQCSPSAAPRGWLTGENSVWQIAVAFLSSSWSEILIPTYASPKVLGPVFLGAMCEADSGFAGIEMDGSVRESFSYSKGMMGRRRMNVVEADKRDVHTL